MFTVKTAQQAIRLLKEAGVIQLEKGESVEVRRSRCTAKPAGEDPMAKFPRGRACNATEHRADCPGGRPCVFLGILRSSPFPHCQGIAAGATWTEVVARALCAKHLNRRCCDLPYDRLTHRVGERPPCAVREQLDALVRALQEEP